LEVTDDDRDEMLQHLKKVTYPDELFVSCVVQWMKEEKILFQGAPFEAEWQLVHLQRRGIIDYVYSTDGDSIILGVERLITNIDFHKKQIIVIEKASILCNNGLPLSRYAESSWPEIACMLGCDYVARVPGVGAATLFRKILPPLIDIASPPPVISTDILLTRLKEVSKKVPNDYEEQYKRSVNLFRFCPILDGNGILSPLNPLPDNSSWHELIGFDPYTTLSISPSKFRECSTFLDFSFFTPHGSPLRLFPVPTYSSNENKEVCSSVPLPRYARLDFDAIPLACMHISYLQGFLAARFGHSFDGARNDIEDAVRRAFSFGKQVMTLEKVPKQIGEWDVTEVLIPSSESSVWLDRFTAYACIINELQPIGDSMIHRFYPEGNENNRNRALELVKGGNLLLPKTLAMQRCHSTKENDIEVFLFKTVDTSCELDCSFLS